ncbi:hypothetical protein DIPPA_16105 [Diplonema papillatum]|nr:hypothetical protein DIPPA_16105 [Diplonema papillatum]
MAQMSTISVANQDEAERCVSKGEEYLRKLQVERAISFWERATRISPDSSAAAKAKSLIEAARKELSSGRAPRVVETHGATAGPGLGAAAPAAGAQTAPASEGRAGEGEQPESARSADLHPPSFARRTPQLVSDACSRVYQWLLDLVGSFGILPPYRPAILVVYLAIFLMLVYRSAFGWSGVFHDDAPPSQQYQKHHARPPADSSAGYGSFDGFFSVATVLHGLSLLSLFGFFPSFLFVSAGGPFTFLTVLLSSLFFQQAFRRPQANAR